MTDIVCLERYANSTAGLPIPLPPFVPVGPPSGGSPAHRVDAFERSAYGLRHNIFTSTTGSLQSMTIAQARALMRGVSVGVSCQRCRQCQRLARHVGAVPVQRKFV